jgi:hypothetical protein
VGASWEKARKPRSLLWGGMAPGGLGAAAPIMAFSLEDTPQQAAGFFIGLSSLMGSKFSLTSTITTRLNEYIYLSNAVRNLDPQRHIVTT